MNSAMAMPLAWAKNLRKNTLVINAFYLMASTLVVAGAGFVFWVVVAKRYDTTAVGLATTLLSVSNLLSLLGLAGFDTTFVRFLPGTLRKNEYINSGFIVVTVLTLILATVVGLILPLVSPSLGIVRSPWAFASFVFFTVATGLNVLTNAVFLAYKRARYIFIINSLFSGFKVVLPLIIVGDAITIFTLSGLAQLLGVILSIAWMHRKFDYRFAFFFDHEAIKVVRKFSLSVYSSSILNLLPPTLLPLIIVADMGPKNAAFYYMAFTIAGVLYTIAYASTQSAFAEGSHDEKSLMSHVARAAKLIGVLLIPAAIITAVASHLLLTTFGKQYAGGATTLLQIFALSALPVAGYSALGAIFKVTKNLRAVVTMNIGYTAAIVSLSLWLVPRMGLLGVGWAWLIGNILACGIGASFIKNKGGRQGNGKTATARRR
ncbi:MAG TPA: oligosaccharide flippase family protein [Candidatus Acidoferrum sp.]|nr:oligosaccharide flippase family protein [Candidatus Acidoferrum sp.]